MDQYAEQSTDEHELRRQLNPYSEHLVLFVDFLGFSNASAAQDPEHAHLLLGTLREIAMLRGAFKFEVTATGPGAHRVKVSPQVITFSDHIVASYPLTGDKLLPIQ